MSPVQETYNYRLTPPEQVLLIDKIIFTDRYM